MYYTLPPFLSLHLKNKLTHLLYIQKNFTTPPEKHTQTFPDIKQITNAPESKTRRLITKKCTFQRNASPLETMQVALWTAPSDAFRSPLRNGVSECSTVSVFRTKCMCSGCSVSLLEWMGEIMARNIAFKVQEMGLMGFSFATRGKSYGLICPLLNGFVRINGDFVLIFFVWYWLVFVWMV